MDTNIVTVKKPAARNKFFLYGGTFIAKLAPYINEKLGDVCGTIIGPSPLSWKALISRDSACSWLEEMDKALCELKPDYFIFDLQRVISILFEENGDLISPLKVVKPNETIPEKFHLIDPLLLSKKQRNMFLDQFISVVKKHFDSDHIVLLHTTYSKYYIKNNFIQAVKEEPSKGLKTEDRVRITDECEKYLLKNKIKFIDVSKFYFYLKEPGRPLTDVIFESGCYEDTINCIVKILKGEPCNMDRPSFEITLKRNYMYRDSFFKKAFQVFLKKNYFIDEFIASLPISIIERYFNDLLLIDSLDWNDAQNALSEMYSLKLPYELYRIIYTFYYLVNGEYQKCSEEDYVHLFKMRIVPQSILSDLQRNAAYFGCVKRQITVENAGYYFAILNGYNKEKFIWDSNLNVPVVVDVFGSCFSRHCFSLTEGDLAVGCYWFHVPCWEPNNPVIKYPYNDLFKDKADWADQLVQLQFEKGVFKNIMESKGEWLVVDLYFFTTPHTYSYEGLVYTDYNQTISKKLNSDKVTVYDDMVLGDFDELMNKSVAWCDLVKKRYKNHIILINAQRSRFWIGDDNKIYIYKTFYPENEFMQKAFEWFSQKLECYTIDVNRLFISDGNGIIKQAPAHKEDSCYIFQYEIIKKIVKECPKEKNYSFIPGSLQVDRILRLIRTNSLYAMEQVFNATFFDSIVIRMDYHMISQYRKNIAEIYDLQFSDYDAMMIDYAFDDCDELKTTITQIASGIQPAKPEKLEKNYPTYENKNGGGLFCDISSDYHPQQVPKPKNFICTKIPEGCRLSWDVGNDIDKYVIYFRNSETDKWHKIVDLPAGVCSYDHLNGHNKEMWYSVKAYRIVGTYRQYGKRMTLHFIE